MSPKKVSAVTRVVTKRSLIDKANTTMLIATGVAAFLVVFSLVSARGLISKISYQEKVISHKKETKEQLERNIKARDSLVTSYQAFTGTSRNVIDGNTVGSGDRDGENGKIILDALPSKYDFPALTSSLEKLAQQQNMSASDLSGTDDEVAQSKQAASGSPQPVPIPFQMTVSGSSVQIQNFITSFERSIRPIQIQTLSISTSDTGLSAAIGAQTFYQPAKILQVRKEVLK